MTVQSTTTVSSGNGDGSTTEFPYDFKIFAAGDLTVIVRSAAGTETVKQLTTDYTVTNVGVITGGDVVFVTAPVTGETVFIRRNMELIQETDYTPNDPFPATSHEDALDRLTFIAQQQQEELDRSIKLSRTNTMTSTEFTVGASDRANKILAFDGSGEISVTQELGTYRGTDTTTTTEAYVVRDIIKSTTAAELNNVYICVADAVVGDLLTDTDHFELLVDAVSAAASATTATTQAGIATTKAGEALASANTAESHKDDAETAQGLAESARDDAQTAQGLAESARDDAQAAETDFRDTYYGSFANDSAAETYQTGTNGGTVDAGDLYFNSTSNTLKIYNGSTWQDAALTAADFLTVANNLSDLNNAGTARTNLGLGTAATSASTDFVAVTGDAMTGNLTLGDNNKAIFGAGNDLEIYHDGSNSYISDQGTGGLFLQGTGNVIIEQPDGTNFIQCNSVGWVRLHYGGSNRFETTSTGIQVTGTALATTDTDTTNTGDIILNFEDNQNFVLTLTGDITLKNPTTEQVGQSGMIAFIQDSTGNRGVSLESNYQIAGGGASLALSSTGDTTDLVPYFVVAADRILLGTPQLAFS